jgi:hypothetical protein
MMSTIGMRAVWAFAFCASARGSAPVVAQHIGAGRTRGWLDMDRLHVRRRGGRGVYAYQHHAVRLLFVAEDSLLVATTMRPRAELRELPGVNASIN